MISVIIPAYNAGRTLAACLDSLRAQTHTDWQGIIIDDGSTDNTRAIAEQYAAQDRRITVLHQPNGGECAARNAGLAAATGEYIAFIDADDTVLPTYLQHMAEAAQGADLVVAGMKTVPAGTVHMPQDEQYRQGDVGRYVEKYVNLGLCYASSCAKLLRRDIITANNLQYLDGVRCSLDRIFNLDFLLHCRSVATVAAADYIYDMPTGYSLEQKYHFSLPESSLLLTLLMSRHAALSEYFHCNVSTAERMLPFGVCHTSTLLTPAAADEYRALYRKAFPERSDTDLLNDEFCSPLLKFAYLLKVTPPSELRAAQGLMQAFADSTWAQHAAHVRYPSRLIAAIVRLAAARHYTLLTLLLRLRQALSRLKIKA